MTTAEPNLGYFARPDRQARRHDRGRHRGLRDARRPGPALARDPRARSRPRSTKLGFFDVADMKIAQVARHHLAHRLHRRPRATRSASAPTTPSTVLDAIIEAGEGHGFIPFGEEALLMTRIEAGLVLINVEFSSSRFAFTDHDRVTAKELGFGWMLKGIDADDRPFIGRNAIRKELADKTSRWASVGLLVDWAGLQPALHRGRPDPAQGRDAARLRVDAVRRRRRADRLRHQPDVLADAAAPHRDGPGATRSSAPSARASTSSSPSTTSTRRSRADVARLPLFNPPRKTA